MAFDDFDTQIQCDEIKDWYDYEMYFGALMAEEVEVPEEHDDYMRSCYQQYMASWYNGLL